MWSATLVTELLRVSDRGNWEVFEKPVVKKYLLTYGILALFGVCNLRKVGTHVLVRCRVEIGFTVCEICKYISFIKNVLNGFSCFSFVSRAQYFVTQKRGGIATLDKKLSHFQAFGLKVFIFTAKATKTKKLRERNGLLGVVGMRRGVEKIAMGVSRFVGHRSGKSIAIDRYQNV